MCENCTKVVQHTAILCIPEFNLLFFLRSFERDSALEESGSAAFSSGFARHLELSVNDRQITMNTRMEGVDLVDLLKGFQRSFVLFEAKIRTTHPIKRRYVVRVQLQ